MTALLTLESIEKRFATTTVVRGVSFTAEAGEFIAIRGPSGSGKSTLLNIIGLIEAPTGGSLRFEGRAVTFTNDSELTTLRRTLLGYVFQAFNLLPGLTAEENVAFPLALQGSTEAYTKAAEALSEVELSGAGHLYPHQLSGGQKQRVAVARALVHAPKIVLADEPTGNLDSQAGRVVLNLLQRAASRGALVLMATHSEEANACASRTLRIRDGLIGE